MNKKFLACFFLATVVLLTGVLSDRCMAAYHLLDNKLRVKGSLYEFMMYRTDFKREERQYRDTEWGLMRTKATLELLYKAVDTNRLIVNLFGFFHYWHESVPDFDDEYRRSIPAGNRKKYQGPFYDQDDWINELYADIYWGPWNIRLGKQIVFWSEVEMVRTIDRINQLDLRYTTPGIDPWDEMKLGLWMMRGSYESELPGQLVFEWIWIPGDYEGVRTPREGSSMGASPAPEGPDDLRPRPFGQGAAVERMWSRSQPSFTLSNSTFALRIRGNSEVALFHETYLLDWTLTYYHGMNNTPVPNRKTMGEASVLNMDPATVNGYMSLVAVSRVFGQPIPGAPRGLWEYKFFDAIGASLQTFVPPLKGVVRAELSYEIGLPEIKATRYHIDPTPGYQKLMTGTTNRDVINVGVTFDRPVRWQWLQQRWGANGVLDCTLGWFGQWRLGNVNRIRRTFAYRDRSQTNVTLTVRTRLWHNELWPTIRALYNTRNWGYGVMAVRYTPGKHMRYELGFLWFFAREAYDFREANAENKDSIYFRIGYEF